MEFSISKLLSTVLLVLALVDGSNGQDQRTATCKVASGSGNGTVSGTVNFSQPKTGGDVTIVIKLTSLTPEGEHGFHVHAIASLGNKCVDAGVHLNIKNTTHGAPYDPEDKRHTGDLGNIVADKDGNVNVTIQDWLISLTGTNSIIGKPIVIHAKRDDLGKGGAVTSNTTGDAGARLGCCLIEDTTVGGAGLTTFSLITLLLAGLAGILLRG